MDRLEELRKEQEKRVVELWHKAEEIEVDTGIGKEHHRYFVVDLYEGNTETLGCLNMLAQISKWFTVKPLKREEIERILPQLKKVKK